jgi:hypothetical protein
MTKKFVQRKKKDYSLKVSTTKPKIRVIINQLKEKLEIFSINLKKTHLAKKTCLFYELQI